MAAVVVVVLVSRGRWFEHFHTQVLVAMSDDYFKAGHLAVRVCFPLPHFGAHSNLIRIDAYWVTVTKLSWNAVHWPGGAWR